MRRDCKNVFILTLLICFISVGYSFLETNLAISGVVDVSKYNPPTFTVSDIVNKSNPPGKNYQTSTDSEKGEMYGFYHPTTLQTPTLTDYRYIGGSRIII